MDEFEWRGREDKGDTSRVWQRVQPRKPPLPPEERRNLDLILLGYASDEGVRRNKGRLGASDGPNAIRQALCNKVLHPNIAIRDLGDIHCKDADLNASQRQLSQTVSEAIQSNFFPVLLGGGHDIAYAHFMGLHAAHPSKNIGIINIDAHFDVRAGEPSSGTPFLQIARHLQSSNKPFNYLCLGAQMHSNTPTLFETMATINGKYVLAENIQSPSSAQILQSFMQPLDAIYLTICLDAFSSAIAPGVSAPQSLGIFPFQIQHIFNAIIQSSKLIALDVAEMNPHFDRDNQTANLAADLIASILSKMSWE